MNNKIVVVLLGFFILISIFLHFYKLNEVPPCINADEAAFGYNAYSILKTGKDEYGSFMPLRFKSFSDYKLPIYTYLSVPFVAIFGLNDFSTRAVNIVLGIAFVPLMYLLAKELFDNKKIALLAAFLTSFSPGIYILSRHAHEGVAGTFFILLTLLFLVKYLKARQLKDFLFANVFLLLNAFSYQTGRVYLLIFFLLQLGIIFLEKKSHAKNRIVKIAVLVGIVIFSLFYDAKYGLNRVNNLLFFKNAGFSLKITEYLSEHPNRLIHNKLTEAVRDIANRYVSQFSPEYLTVNGDLNIRFGFSNLSLFTIVEYFLFFVGVYYLFKNKEKYRYLLTFFLFIAPLNNALTWQTASLIRTYAFLFPVLLTISYGSYHSFRSIQNKHIRIAAAFIVITAFIFFKYLSWDIYFNHYPKRAITIRAWQCGYKELVDYIKPLYKAYDNFYITDRHGQPYIYFLYYWPFDPGSYQKQAKISAPDQYGFGQVGKFDKFDFSFNMDHMKRRSVYVGYPESFSNAKPEILNNIDKITVGPEEIFWIYKSD